MASKKALLGGAHVKVENMSGFDKSRFNAFTAPLGAIVPMAKQLLIPGKFKLRVSLSAQLPPLATDAFLRSHLKVEAFLVPMRLCYGGFSSWFCGEKVAVFSNGSLSLTKAKLPYFSVETDAVANIQQTRLSSILGPHSLLDYLGVKYPLSNSRPDPTKWPTSATGPYALSLNIFPMIAYQLCYHHWYRNKLIQNPLFAPPSESIPVYEAYNLPYVSYDSRKKFYFNLHNSSSFDNLLQGSLHTLRVRNYGFDYFTTALPSAQEGSPMQVSTAGNVFTISALRASNTLQHFVEVNQLASADFVQTCMSRYGKAPSSAVAQKPILLGSADFPMFTSGVEQTAQDQPASPNGNPFAGIGARYGRAHAEGSDFVCEGEVDEPSYLMVMCSVVPEANYASGIPHDMQIFTEEGSIADLPCAMLENIGYEPVMCRELYTPSSQWSSVFGYQPRYMWHKAAAPGNEVHGLFRKGASLESFIPQRDFDSAGSPPVQISSNFLAVAPSDLDNVTAVAGQLSLYGVMVDSSIQLFVTEALGEGSLPSLANPAEEHGRSVYLTRGASSLNG